ncbi:MAG: SHOCT domain-containing protein [Desulforhopalus sp.]|nr:SHOCT domain-containing protein [Desulforhopalus sp.]
MNPRVIALIIILFFTLINCCAPAPFVLIGEDTYTISQTSSGGVFKSMSSLRTEVISRANEFAKSKGKLAVAVAEKESPSYPGHMPSFTYTFRLVSGLGGVRNTDNSDSNRAVPKDFHDKLLKLDDLRTKGIITQTEFEEQKAKILSGI